ncbi:MAG TPA: hypothetical protein DHW02_12615 [Ktedonobacter sp.]|nr:hypothetical protein [Ktedonobacter sp.]
MGMDTTPDKHANNRQRDLARLTEINIAEAPSRGERLLPYLFAAMETCWIDAILIGIASLGFMAGSPPVPLWSPFVFIAGLCWLSISRERRAHNADTSSLNNASVIALLVLSVLLTLWSSIYASSISLLNPLWLVAILNDLLLLNGNAFHIVFVLLVIAYFCWRGIRLSRNALEPGSVSNTLRVGLFILLVVILLRALDGSQSNMLALLLLVPLFLVFVLVTHSLAQATLLRRSHPTGLQGSITTQENALFTIIALIGLVLLFISLSIGAVVNPAFLSQVQSFFSPVAVAYDWLAHGIAYIATLLVTPFFWLFQLLHVQPALPKIPKRQLPPGAPKAPDSRNSTNPEFIALLVHIIAIILPILVVLLIIVGVRLILRRRNIRLTRRQEDQHESLWSWSLFWTQLRAFFKALFQRFFPTRSREQSQAISEEITGKPTARTIREIYRALLRWSAARGLARKRAETPYEFRTRLSQRLPLAEPELSLVTEAYTATRYGRAVPNEDDVARVREAWTQLQQRQFPS